MVIKLISFNSEMVQTAPDGKERSKGRKRYKK